MDVVYQTRENHGKLLRRCVPKSWKSRKLLRPGVRSAPDFFCGTITRSAVKILENYRDVMYQSGGNPGKLLGPKRCVSNSQKIILLAHGLSTCPSAYITFVHILLTRSLMLNTFLQRNKSQIILQSPYQRLLSVNCATTWCHGNPTIFNFFIHIFLFVMIDLHYHWGSVRI